MDVIMQSERISFLQINNWGSRDNSILVINAYLEKQKSDVGFLNKTKQEAPEKAFTSFTALSSISNKMAEGVVLLFQYNVIYAQIKEFPTKDNENIVAAADIRGLKILTVIAYSKAEEKVNSLNSKKRLEAFKSNADKNHTICVHPIGGCKAMHYFWGDQQCNALGNELLSPVPTDSQTIPRIPLSQSMSNV